MNGQVLDPMKQRKRKSLAQPSKAKKSLGSSRKELGRIPENSQVLEILGTYSKARLGLRQFEGACQETQRTRTDMSLSTT